VVDVVVFEGSGVKSSVEEMLVKIRHAALADNLAKLTELPEVDRIFLVTNRPELMHLADGGRITIEVNHTPPAQFHFGRQLLDLVDRHKIKTLLYLGGAAVPLIQPEELALACRLVMEQEGRYVTNNVQSADMVAFSPASVLRQYPLPATDNALPLLLRFDARFEQKLLPATLGSQFDIDTPTDLLLLAASPFGGLKLRAELDKLGLDLSLVSRLKEVLCGEYQELALVGRVGAPAIARINHHFKVRLRIFSEERGMKALGRIERGEVVSLLGCWLEEIGPARFFDYLARTSQAALIDSRVIFAHQKLELSDAARFYSDLGRYEDIEDRFTREFTRAAGNCGIPVLLGGHSLVTGGIWALVEEIGCRF
jgi:hypothetical protein